MTEKGSSLLTETQFNGEVITQQLLDMILNAGKTALDLQDTNLIAKLKSSKEDLVTKADILVTTQIKQTLNLLLPDCMVVDEETDSTHGFDFSTNTGLVAVVDPIDGTSNYFKASQESNKELRNPNWGISIGFVRNQEIVAGIIYQPQSGKLFYSEKGKGAYMNSVRLNLSKPTEEESLSILFGHPYPKDEREFGATTRAHEEIDKLGIKRSTLSSSIAEAMEVAQGKKGAHLHFKSKPWDVAAAISIVTEAGGICTDLEGNPYKLFRSDIMLANPNFNTKPLIEITSERFRDWKS